MQTSTSSAEGTTGTTGADGITSPDSPGGGGAGRRAVRAAYTDTTLTVYQAYPSEIARAAVRAGTFVAPFKRDRMTWIKPSFLWMMYRSGWARKPGQERVLAVEICREGFAWALAHASLSHFDAAVHTDHAAWRQEVAQCPVRVQWDPDRTPSLAPLPRRAIQVGLSGEAVRRYVDEWIVGIRDITDTVRAIHSGLRDGQPGGAATGAPELPVERGYPLPDGIRRRLGASAR